MKISEFLAGSLISTKQLIWYAEDCCEERDAAGSITKRFFADGQTISGSSYFYTANHLGSIVQLCDTAANVRAEYAYEPFGRTTKVQGTQDSDFQFADYYSHSRSALYITLYRAYSPTLGRWLTRDPIEETAGSNLYCYVQNEPIGWIDILGLDTSYTGLASYYNLKGYQTATQEPFDPDGMNGAMTKDKVPDIPTTVTVETIPDDPDKKPKVCKVKINDRGPFAVGKNGRALKPLRPHPTRIIDLTPKAFKKLGGTKCCGAIKVKVTVPSSPTPASK